MIKFIKKYWIELLVFGAIFGGLLVCLSPNITWMSTDSDGAHYILAAKYMTVAHHMSAPLYLLIGHVFLWIPMGTEAWRMGLISMLATVGCCVFIYLIVRRLLKDNSKARLYAIISSLVYGGSALVISQSTIIETYTLATMCGVGAYYFALTKRWSWSSVLLGIGIAVHPFLAFIAWVVLFFTYKEMRNWRRYLITIAFFAFYLYIPIIGHINPNDNMWGNETTKGFFGGTFGMVLMLTGGLSMWDMPKRFIDTILILLVSFGLGIIPLIYNFVKTRTWRNHLLWLVLIPVIFFAINLTAETYVYMIVAIAFGSIAVGLGLSNMRKKWAIVVLIATIGLMSWNTNYFDIGRTLDSEMSAMKFYNEELPKIPDGEIFMGGGWNWSMVYLYNKEEHRNIIPISTDSLPDDNYVAILKQKGIQLETSNSKSYITKQGEIELSIAELNEGVWIAKETKPEVYQYVIELAKGNETYVGRWIGQELQPEWKWKPSNPYLYISGQLEVKEWHHILQSSRNAFFIISLVVYGWFMSWVLIKLWKRRKKNVSTKT